MSRERFFEQLQSLYRCCFKCWVSAIVPEIALFVLVGLLFAASYFKVYSLSYLVSMQMVQRSF